MSSPEQALQAAVVAALAADARLHGAGPSRASIFDRLIDKAEFPYLVLGAMTTLDWSTATETGTEHVFSLEAWSGEAGKLQVQEIVARRARRPPRPAAAACRSARSSI